MSIEALQKKDLGNAALQQGDFNMAVKYYSEGIELDPRNHILYSNRSAAYHSLGNFQNALADAEKVIEIEPSFWKGYSRKGIALYSLGMGDESLQAYQEGLVYNSGERSLMEGVDSARELIRSKQSRNTQNTQNTQNADPQNMIIQMMMSQFQGDPLARARSYPECSAFAGAPDFVKKIKEIQANPAKIMEYIQDEQISTFISAGLQRSGPGDTEISEEELAKRRMEQREEMLRREEEERVMKKEHEKKKEGRRKTTSRKR
jgi:stress-induced-phosphoprotein 1